MTEFLPLPLTILRNKPADDWSNDRAQETGSNEQGKRNRSVARGPHIREAAARIRYWNSGQLWFQPLGIRLPVGELKKPQRKRNTNSAAIFGATAQAALNTTKSNSTER